MLKQFLLDKIIIKKNQNFEHYDGKKLNLTSVSYWSVLYTCTVYVTHLWFYELPGKVPCMTQTHLVRNL